MLALINDAKHYGGAALIRREQEQAVVLTAAHCLNYDLNHVIVSGGSLKWFEKSTMAKVREYYVHPDYALPAGIDLAVLILDGALTGVPVGPPLAGQDDGALYQTGKNVTMAGWGPSEINGKSWDDLQVLTLPLVDPGGCSTEDRASNVGFACCRSDNEHTTPGDSGGPMIGGSQDSRKLVAVIEGGVGGASIATRADLRAAWIGNPEHVHSYVVASGPAAVAVVPAAGRKYVLHGDGTVSVLDAGWAAVSKLPAGQTVRAIAGSPVGKSAYIADREAVREVNAETNAVTRSVSISGLPSLLAVTPDGKFLAVAHGSSVTILATGDLSAVKTFGIGETVSAMAVAPDSEHVYVTSADNDQVQTIKIPATTMTSWNNGQYGNGFVAASADRVYVSEVVDTEVSVRDRSGDEQARLKLQKHRQVKALAVSGRRVYVGYETDNSTPAQVGVEVFDTGSDSPVCTRQFGAGPLASLTPLAGGGVLAVNRTVSSISVVIAPV